MTSMTEIIFTNKYHRIKKWKLRLHCWQWMRLNNETKSDTYHFNFENLLGINSSVLIKY